MNTISNKGIAALLTAVAVSALLAACGSSAADARLSVVASTDVYGNIARTLAAGLPASDVRVTSIISDPDQDPHSYEANAVTELELSKADVVVENGGGYDDFVDTMLRAHSRSDVRVVNAVRISGKHVGADFNEHVWYDFATVLRVAARLSAAMTAADRADAATFSTNLAAFDGRVRGLQRAEAAIRARHAGAGVAITEPVPLYMLQACGLVNRTPAQFSAAVENGTGVSVRVLQQTLQLFRDRKVVLLAYNEQTSGPETSEVLAAARAAGVAVVPVTETLPSGRTYLSWMAGNLAAISAALGA